VQLRYNVRLDPTPGQVRDLAKAFGCARVVFNDALALRRKLHAAGEPYLPDAQLQRRVITEAKRTDDRAWLSEVSSVVLVQALGDLHTAYRNFFNSITGKRKGPKLREPRFRSRKDNRQAIRFTRNGFSLRSNGRLYLAKIGEIPVRWSRDLPSDPSSVTIVKDASGRYFASFVVVTDQAEDLARFPADDQYAETGIDLGLTHFAVLSDGKKVESPKFLRRTEKKLKKMQQSLARKQKGSNNRRKSAVKVAKAHAHVADSRRDFHHKLSTRIIAENQGVYVEELAVNGLGRTRLAKSVHDAGWSMFVGMLEYKAARYGRAFAKVDRWAPTSQVCSACGVPDGKKPLHIREWRCADCGTLHDRDVNAAINIRNLGAQVAAGRAETLNARGAQASPGLVPAQRDEAGTRRSDRTLSVSGAAGIPVL
jgi:putative transposase